jgi:TPR repeat protein/AcrR family transcriptional regulator
MSETAAVNLEPDKPHTTRLMDVAAARRMAVAAARRVIARDGAGRMTLDSVGHEAGLPLGALASHFDNEQELFMAVAADDLAALAKSMRSSASANPSPDLIQRVEVLETAFASMIDRHQRSLRQRNDMATWVEECVKDLQQQVDVSDRAFSQMRSEVKATLPPVTPSKPVAYPPLPAKVARLLVEPPPIAGMPAPSAPPPETRPGDLPPMPSPQTAPVTSNSEEAVLMDNYLLDARRAAIATQAGNERERHETKRRTKRARVLAAAFLGPVAILATAAMVLNRNVVTAMPSLSAVAPPPQIAEPAPNLATAVPSNPQPKTVQQAAPQAAPQAPAQVTAAPPATPTPSQLPATEPLDKLTELATSGNVKAERDLGLKYLAGDGVQANETEAARWLMRAAYRGEPTAEYWLGTLYARGHGVPEDAFQANHWYEAAAQKGNRRAMHSFAVAYFQGWGVEKNYSEAARWFRSAADLGFVDSQFNLAVLYERGAGLQQSLTEAYKWYAIAAKGGDKEADARVAALATQLAPAELALAQQAAASFKPAPMDQDANLAGEPRATDG